MILNCAGTNLSMTHHPPTSISHLLRVHGHTELEFPHQSLWGLSANACCTTAISKVPHLFLVTLIIKSFAFDSLFAERCHCLHSEVLCWNVGVFFPSIFPQIAEEETCYSLNSNSLLFCDCSFVLNQVDTFFKSEIICCNLSTHISSSLFNNYHCFIVF